MRWLGGEYEDLEEWVLKVRLAASWEEKEALLEDERWMLTVLEAPELVSGYLDMFRGELNRRASSIAAEIRGSGRRYCVYPTPIRQLQRMVFEEERAEIRRAVAKRWIAEPRPYGRVVFALVNGEPRRRWSTSSSPRRCSSSSSTARRPDASRSST